MKRLISFLLALILLLSFASCGVERVVDENAHASDSINVSEDESKKGVGDDASDDSSETGASSDSSQGNNATIEGDGSEDTDDSKDNGKEEHVHKYEKVVTEPTEEAEGYTTNTCSCGESYISDKVPKKITIPLVVNDVAKAKIVMAADADRYVWYARDRIQLSVSGITGVSLLEDGSADIEIHIGDTGSAESVSLKATLGANEYAIKVVDKKIIIVASNPAFLYEAVKYFVDNYFKAPSARVGEKEITLLTDDINVKRAGDKSSLHYQFSTGKFVSAVGVPMYSIDNDKYGPKDANPRYWVRQGGFFTGEVFYQAFVNGDDNMGVIQKKNMKTGETLYSAPRDIGHANDMAYDPETNRIMVGDSKDILFFDADTLEYIETKTVEHSAVRLSYYPERSKYVIHFFYIYNEKFEYTGQYFGRQLSQVNSAVENPDSFTGQGTDCDDTFIYWLLHIYENGVYNVYVAVYDWYGNILTLVEVSIPGGHEPESISSIDGTLYIATASPQPTTMLSRVDFGMTEQYSKPLTENGETVTKIVLPADAGRNTLYARDKIQLAAENLSGVKFAEEGNADFEILIGDTGRAESIALKATLGADEYAIKLIGNKIVIVASNEVFLYEAAKLFVDEYMRFPFMSIADGKIVLLTDTIDVRRAGNKASMNYLLTKGNKFTLDTEAKYTLDNQKYGATDADPRIHRRQGGCFTGEVYYQVLITQNEKLAVVARKNVKTGDLIYSEPRLMDHANDATYDPYNNRLIVGNTNTVWIYDGDTLEFIESKTLSHTTSRVSYSAERHTYIMGSYYFYDDSFTYTNKYVKSTLKTIYGDLSLSSQGTACDDVFIYSLLIEATGVSGKYNAYLGVLDWYGNTLAFITINIEQGFEPENVSVIDGKLYIAACSTQPVATLYEVKFG